jgi:drug/metabolite transporter (DMT)-like permease
MRLLLPVSLIFLVAINNNSIEMLADKDYTTATIMIYRSAISMLLFASVLLYKRKKIRVNNKKLLLARSFLDGLGILLLVASFKYLAAGSVSLVQRMDIPLLILISVYKQESKSSLQFYLSLWAVILLTFFVTESKLLDEDAIGYALAAPAVLLAACTYYLVKKHTSQESGGVLGFFYSLSLLLWGIGLALFSQDSLQIDWKDFWIFALGGVLQFTVVSISLYLFKRYPSEKARLPFVIAIIATMIVEMLIEKKWFSFSQISLTVILTGIIATICINPGVPKRVRESA